MSGQAPLDPELLERVRRRLVADGHGEAWSSGGPDSAAVVAALRAEGGDLRGRLDLLDVARQVRSRLAGAGPLEALLTAPGVTDVVVDGAGPVRVDRGRGLEVTDVRLDDEAVVRALAVRLAGRAGRRLDDAQPFVDGVLPGRDGAGWRLHAVLPPIAVDGTCISLRVLRPAALPFDALVAGGAVDPEAERLLRGIVAARLSYLVVGGTGSGKTTMLSALLGLVPATERLICVEDSPELRPGHPHVVRLTVRSANTEAAGAVELGDLVRQSLRMRPDRIAVGEVRGAEVVDLLAALNTGHDGSAGTVHANSPEEVPARLEALGALGGLGREALHAQVAASLRVVVGMRRGADGVRRVESVGLVTRGRPGTRDGVEVVPAWRRSSGPAPAAGELDALLHSHGAAS